MFSWASGLKLLASYLVLTGVTATIQCLFNRTADLSAFKNETVSIENLASVIASSSNCIAKKVALTSVCFLDPSLFRNCKNIQLLNLSGNEWDCSQDWWWLIDEMAKQKVEFIVEGNCKNVESSKKDFLSQFVLKDAMQYCGVCSCSVLANFPYSTTMDCWNQSREAIPKEFPRTTDFISYEFSGLNNDDVEKMFTNARYLRNLKIIQLQHNNLTKIPNYFGLDTIKYLVLTENQIAEFDVSVLKEWKKHSTFVLLEGNPLDCSKCSAYYLMEEYVRRGKLIEDMNELRCSNEVGKSPWQIDYTACKSMEWPITKYDLFLVILAIADVFLLYLVIDLIHIRRKMKFSSHISRSPALHRFVIFICNLRYCFQNTKYNAMIERFEIESEDMDGKNLRTFSAQKRVTFAK